MMISRPTQPSSLPSSVRPSASSRLLAPSLHSSALFPFPLQVTLPPSPLSSRSSSRQLFSQLAAPSSSRSLLPGSVAPPNTPSATSTACTATSGGYQSVGPLPAAAGGFGIEVAANLNQRAGHHQLLRYTTETGTAGQQLAQPHQPHYYQQLHLQPLQQGPSSAGGVYQDKSLLSTFSGLSSLPPPLSHPPLPAAFPLDFGPSLPTSPIERTSHSTTTSVLCQSPSSTLSSSSYMSLDDVLDYEVESLVDHFQLPLHLLEPRRQLARRLLHTMGVESSALSATANRSTTVPDPLSHQLAAVQGSHSAEEVPALPIPGDAVPGSLLWQQQVELQERWSHTAHQLMSTMQQQQQTAQHRPQQRYRESGQQYDEDEAAHHSGQSENVSSDRQRVESESESEMDGSSSDDESVGREILVVKRESSRGRSNDSEYESEEVHSEASSCEESESPTRDRCVLKHKGKHGRGRGGSRHKRSKKRKRSQRRDESSDDNQSDDGRQQQRKRRGRRIKTSQARSGGPTAATSSSSPMSVLAPSPHQSPSPSSFSTSTAASSSSTSTSAAFPATSNTTHARLPLTQRRSNRRACGSHRSKLPSRVIAVLRSFFLLHVSHPFPNEDQKRELVSRTELSMKQVCDWFTNNRKRYWKPYERKMNQLQCGLVGAAYQAAQHHTAHGASRRNRERERQAERERADSDSAVQQLRTLCRCGEDDVAIHGWRQMWD